MSCSEPDPGGNLNPVPVAVQRQALRYASPMEWTGARIRMLREVGLCLSQEQFAKKAGFAVTRAEQALDMRSEPQTGSFFSFDAPYLPYYAGTAYAWLGKTACARSWASQAIELCDADPTPWPVARTSARIDLAVALTQAGEHDGAAAVGAEAMDIWAERPTRPARKRIEELVAALRPFNEPCVVELKERWQWISN